MFLAGSSTRSLAAGLMRSPAAAATSSLRTNGASARRPAPGRPAEATTFRHLAALPNRRKGAGYGGTGAPARKDAPTHRRKRPGRKQREGVPRFQPFGRPGGEGAKVAEQLYEEFGMGGRKEYSAEAADERKSLLGWLEGEVRMGPRGVADMLEQEPRLAEQGREAVLGRLGWLKERLMLSEEQIRSLVHRRPSVLCRSVEDGMEPKVRWLQEELNLSDAEVAAMVTSSPNVLTTSIRDSMAPKLGWLSRRLTLSNEQLAMVVTSCPQVLTSSIEGALEPRLRWLQAHLQIGGSVLRERVLTFPWLLNLSEKGKLEPTYDFLKTELLLDDVDIRKTLFRNPRMFLTPMRPTYASVKKWLRESVGMQEEEAVRVVTRDARILLRSTDVLDSKVAFFCQEMGATLEDVRAVLLKSPNLLLVSVDLVLAPRVAALKEAGVDLTFSLHWNELAFGPRGSEFDAWVSRQARRSRR
eukprot:g2525.t1